MSTVMSATSASLFEVIKRRRSIGQVTQEEPTREQIERLLEAATYAPSHYVTEPWHFFVLTGAAREEFGAVMAAALRLHMEGAIDDKAEARLWKERNKALRAPVIIVVTIPKAQQLAGNLIENIAATAAATQNMLLAAEEMGLATIWRTGDAAYDPLVKRWFDLTPDDHIVGFVYIGFPQITRPTRVPTHFSMKTTWLS
ncbi:MAG: nitroreductase [Chloroflexi bacterium]|nr:MAG: nitroreductase [Chloroflexota bacterium]